MNLARPGLARERPFSVSMSRRDGAATVFELRDGKVVRLEIFADREKAIESVRATQSEESGRVA
jgi:hypothetical protein